MKFAEKDFNYYWPAIKIPVLLLILWSALSVIVAKISMYWYNSIFGAWTSIIIQVAIFAFVGHTIVAEHKGTTKYAAWGGALTGAIAGFAGAIIAIIMVYLVPEIIEQAVRQAVAQGAPEGMVRQMTQIGMYVGLVTGPLISGIIGALVAWIAGLITAKKK